MMATVAVEAIPSYVHCLQDVRNAQVNSGVTSWHGSSSEPAHSSHHVGNIHWKEWPLQLLWPSSLT